MTTFLEPWIDARFSPHADHESLNYLHPYISFSYRKRTPYLSVYLQSFETGDWTVGKPINPPKPRWQHTTDEILMIP